MPETTSTADSVLADFRDNGLALIRSAFPASLVAEWSAECDRLHECYRNNELRSLHCAFRPTIDNKNIFERIDPVCDVSEVFAELARDSRILDPIGDLLGEKPALLKDKLIYKFPGDAGYKLHQDQPYIAPEAYASKIAIAAVAIDAIAPENGALSFFLGRHHALQPAPKDAPRDVDPEALAGAAEIDIQADPGSLVLFHPLTPHRSGPNMSRTTRRLIYFTYIAESLASLREEYYRRRFEELRGS
jgi:ectoine hydroxylase-related dioxygenase (phytanoyl-CoA dioxygenase family)